MQGNIQRWRVA